MSKYSIWALIVTSLMMTSCNTHMAVLQQDKHENTVALNEMRSELADLKHALNNAQVEIQILEEQVQNQESLSKKPKVGVSSPNDSKLPQLERRLAVLEQMQEKIHADLKQLSSHANQTSTCLQQYSAKISELEQNVERQKGDLRSSLKTLTSSLSTEVETSSSGTYKVKSGDSLEKIARNHKVSVDALKKANGLSQNKILVGQELIIP